MKCPEGVKGKRWGKCPEGTTDHRQAVERSGTPADDATNNMNPDGVTEYLLFVVCHPVGVAVPMNATSRGFTPACDLAAPSGLCSHVNVISVDFLIAKREPLVILNAVCLQKQSVFLLKRPLLVMLCLAANVLHGLVDERRTDRERSVSLLPCESGVKRVERLHPLAAVGLDGADEVGQRHRLRLRREDMHVVCHAADFYGQTADALDNAADVSEDARQVFRPHLHACALDVEYQMYVNLYQCTCHIVSLDITL